MKKPQPIPQHSPSVARHGPIGSGFYSDFKRLRRRAKKESSEHTDFMTNLKSDDYEKCALIH
ncbi:hypothetical protein [Burkholderia pseudomultivorans]|uniref:hypothetical protein n=1 Tax=Burkholderia pseudomultivorans TaxID=1207504 RepID=UPI000A60564C|nr:hypothetical protein [Burkholderia pseudomultivorans]